ncbi:hypothetical protein BBJ29_000970 [Phytophthora kernoviae]|uniref:Uncharacterized protein n=1 Tax=Phytophthora kernoviae TaxID=325452 RepID=A0A421FSC8_9STRA|nr:hypothetical protein BBJ29_000970 [Phytophthora kernoviae]
MAGREFAHVQPVETLRNRLGLRQVDVSKECGVNASMLSQWMLGRYKGNVGRVRITSIQEQVEKANKSLPWHEAVTSESLHPIFINLRLNDTIYVDRFEWDLSNPHNSPERFAQVVSEDLGLSGEFEAQIALSIREQLRNYSRLIREGLKDRVTRLPPVTAAFRDRLDAEVWGPSVKYILAEDIPQLEREDFKRMRPLSRSTATLISPSVSVAKPNRPPKPVNTFLMFCRYSIELEQLSVVDIC